MTPKTGHQTPMRVRVTSIHNGIEHIFGAEELGAGGAVDDVSASPTRQFDLNEKHTWHRDPKKQTARGKGKVQPFALLHTLVHSFDEEKEERQKNHPKASSPKLYGVHSFRSSDTHLSVEDAA
ncbi:hypothetical protein CEXT_392791 [Caerostris extrusa]|uniref:Uncharacterized protein n=1 Tax=Caerostris extrusa TaxID=172846 RepID=A0AAV4MT96_CAEEX|nr:hypothetical protein CEXT_392791 [Caerostris extrusa]